MALTELQINAMYVALGVDAVWPLRGNLNEALGVIAGTWTGTAGAGIAYTTAGPESSRSGNVATFSGGATSYANLGSLADVGSRVQAGGGLTFGFFFKIASGVTAWRVGTINGSTTQYLYYDVNGSNNQVIYRRNNVEAAYLDSDVAMATAMRDDNWHHFAATYNHATAAWRTYIDGELWSDGSAVSNRNTENDGLTVNISNFMIGAYSFNTAATSPYASAFAEFSVAAKWMSDEEIRRLADIGTATFSPASYLPDRTGIRADQVAERVASDIRTRNPMIVVLGDSRMTRSGQGYVAEPALARKINTLSGGRVANCEMRISDTIDSSSPPGHYLSIASGATQKLQVSLKTNDINNSSNLLGSDNTSRRAIHLDSSRGIACTVGMKKETGGRGPITYVLKGSDLLPGANPLTGSENYQVTIASGTLFSSADLTGSGVAYATVTPPATARYQHYQIELTNTGGSAVILEDVDWLSLANSNGPMIKVAAAGGYKIDSFYSAHTGWPTMFKAYRAFKNNPPIHFIAILGPNDGGNMTPSQWYTAFASFCTSLFTDFPDATLSIAVGGPVEPIGSSGARNNARMRNLAGAVKEYTEANPSAMVSCGNIVKTMERLAGWTPWTQSTSRFNVIGEYAAGTTYSQSNVAWTRTNDTASIKRYWLSRFSSQTGVSLLNADKWTEVIRYLSDGIHYSEVGALVFVDSIIKSCIGNTEAYGDSKQTGGSGTTTGAFTTSTGTGLAA